jgi:hypothetical protein
MQVSSILYVTDPSSGGRYAIGELGLVGNATLMAMTILKLIAVELVTHDPPPLPYTRTHART